MFCRNCGHELEEHQSFCPSCGFPVDPSAVPPARNTSPGMSRRTATAVIVFSVLALAVLFAASSLIGDDEDDSVVRVVVSEDVVVSGDIADGSFIAVGDLGDSVKFVLVDVSNEETHFLWSLTDRYGDEYRRITQEPYLEIPKDDLTPGMYSMSVGSSDSLNGPYSSRSGSLILYGTLTDTFEWTYMAQDLSVAVSYDYADYEACRLNDDYYLKTYGDFGQRVSILTAADPTIASLEEQLRSAYLGAFGQDAPVDGQEYADFILGFVQVCFEYLNDSDLYGRADYWAFPMETLYNGGGDCEDTSFLCAALFDAAGYDAGVFMVPGHALAAIALDDYEENTLWELATHYHTYSYELDGTVYYGCETTVDVPFPAGMVSRDYTITSDGEFLYQGGGANPSDGLYLVA